MTKFKSPASKTLVLFDIDGTLVRGAGQQHKLSLIEGIRTVTGLSTTLENVSTAGMLDRDLITGMLRHAGHSQRRIRLALRSIMTECQNSYAASCSTDLRHYVCVGVARLLHDLQARGAVLALVSGNLGQIGWRKIELAGLRPYFSTGAFAEDGTTRARLAQIAARRAMKQGLVVRNCRVSLIGDHANDVKAAKANGFQSIAVATGLSSLEELRAAEPDILVSDLTELKPELLIS